MTIDRDTTARLARVAAVLWFCASAAWANGAPAIDPARANVLIVSVDTLRADRLSGYGYERPTSRHIDRLLRDGARFDEARTVEPLTSPALCSMITSMEPHQHGSTRNGLRMRTGLPSLPKTMQAHGYRTVAVISNWTLRDKLSGLAEHFDDYVEVLTRARWLGLLRSESTAEDVTEATLDWIDEHRRRRGEVPFLAWAHYTDPHAPYRMRSEHAEALGLDESRKAQPADRYDTEIAAVDAALGELLRGLERRGLEERMLIVFTADHGESLGEHDYWGHGRNLFDPGLRIPLAFHWPGHVAPAVIEAPAQNIDVAPTVLGLLGLAPPTDFEGFDWASVLRGRSTGPEERITYYQAHRGAVISRHDSDLARLKGLLAVGFLRGPHKEIFRIDRNRSARFDLSLDPAETEDRTESEQPPSEGLMAWMKSIYSSLSVLDEEPPAPLDEESVEQLRSLGYVN